MLEVDWTGPLIALLMGLAGGAILAALNRSAGDDPTTDARLEDLRREKDRLLQALRDLQDTRTGEATAEERTALETRAAEVLRLLEEEAPAAAPASDASSPAPAPAAAARPSTGGMSSELKGALKGGLAGGFIAVLAVVLMNGTSERQDGMSITGAVPEVRPTEARVTVPGAGETGGAVPGVPPDLQPKASPAVDTARAKVSSDPGTIDHWAELGYALIDAEGWIDAWNVSEEITKRVPGHPDGLVIGAMVRIAMGQADRAAELLDQALVGDPKHLMGLTYRGMLAAQTGDVEGAKKHWLAARDLAPSAEDKTAFDELLARVEAGTLPTASGAAGHPGAGHPPATGAQTAHPGTAPTAASGTSIEGTITLAPGAKPPPGAVIFIIARPEGVTRGPPAASKKLLASSFPTTFVLGPGDVMMGGPFPDEVELSARLDEDGNAMTKGAADLNGSAGLVSAGATDVVIQLEGP